LVKDFPSVGRLPFRVGLAAAKLGDECVRLMGSRRAMTAAAAAAGDGSGFFLLLGRCTGEVS
jgi:hypothetical protein